MPKHQEDKLPGAIATEHGLQNANTEHCCRACVIEYFSYGAGHGDVVHVHGVLSYPINRDDGDVDDCIDVHFGDADVVVELVIVLSLSWW